MTKKKLYDVKSKQIFQNYFKSKCGQTLVRIIVIGKVMYFVRMLVYANGKEGHGFGVSGN